jgi:phage terminase large subunit-like protein
MRKHNFYFRIDDCTHGNQKKTERIVWALQGRFEHGKVILNVGDWNNDFIDQLVNFPNSQLHDDLVDSLAYIDQINIVDIHFDDIDEEYEVLDAVSGY